MKEKRSVANDLFWILGVAAVGISVFAVYSMSEDAFYAAAFFGLCAGVFFLYDSSGEES